MFFRFAPMGNVEKTRFEQNYTTFVNPAFCAAWKTPPKMVVWNRNCKIRFPGCFFVSPRWGKSKKRVLNKIIRPSSTRLYALLEKPHPRWWYETEIVKFDSQGVFSFRPDGKSPKTRFEQNYTTFVNPALCAAWKSPSKMVVWNRNCKIRFPGCFFVSPRWGKSRKRVLNKIIRPSSTRLYALLGKAHPKWWYETEIVKFDSQGVFSFRPMGKVEKTRFEQNYTTFVNPALCAAWKSPPKMVVWNRNCKIRFPWCFFVSPRWGKSKKRVLNKIIRPSSTRLYALPEKPHPRWWYETEILKFDSQGVFSFRPDGESRKNAFWTKLYDLRQPGFMRCLEKPIQNGSMKPKL